MDAFALTPRSIAAARRPAYVEQDSNQTLAEALAEYYAVNEGRVLRPSDLPPESAALFRYHDLCHVIFGLDTTLPDEVMADTRTLLSCDVGMMRYARYLGSAQAKALFKEIGVWPSIWATVRTSPRVVIGIVEALRMKKRWPWSPPEAFMVRTLADLREEFGVRVI